MKFAEQLFPKGTFPGQQTDGAYIDETLATNLDVIAEKVGEDMQFTIVMSGHDMVGNGKTTLATHVACYLTTKINEFHKTNNTFTHKNMVMKGVDLPTRSFGLPKHSVIVLDEGDDLTTHGMKQAAVTLKRYFRKCRQLNQVLILILPSFFELPKFYALSRSQALIDVTFQERFERGYFAFYGMRAKKDLYIKGHKEWNYDVVHADFKGRFFSSYCFFPNCIEETAKYKAIKHQDMVDDHEKSAEEDYMKPAELKAKYKAEMFTELYSKLKKFKGVTQQEMADALGVHRTTIQKWIYAQKQGDVPSFETELPNAEPIINKLTREGENFEKESEEQS